MQIVFWSSCRIWTCLGLMLGLQLVSGQGWFRVRAMEKGLDFSVLPVFLMYVQFSV